ncbi:alpha/beta-hydrolase [Trichodelitschia bisporula]|uniref:Alpha/beta-hydrolase n=1 Tax=Trichodelitschia bisporula TaxID=703511 RepID=A0A6G1I5K4_9PEZI|nr:alpha/beta-hydrolase [Trichodelitschia bisporula]
MAPKRHHPILGLLWKAFQFGYGLVVLVSYIALAFIRKRRFRKLSDRDRELLVARDRLWNLNKTPHDLKHRFCILRAGTKLHYVESVPPADSTGRKNLIIFIHGFPDSWALWSHHLRNNELRQSATLIALDLPGFGGSDTLPDFGSTTVLEAITEFILAMRATYLTPDTSSRVLLVAHDWGALIGFRLASEAPQLADRFILSNSFHPPLAVSNARNRLSTAARILRTWTTTPSALRLPLKAASLLTPLLSQLFKSGYVFLFNLPAPLAAFPASLGDHWLLRYNNALAAHPDPSTPLEGPVGAKALASTLGPSMSEITAPGPESYPEAVRTRLADGGWMAKLALYRQGMASDPWTKSLETLWELNELSNSTRSSARRASGAGVFDLGPEGALRARVTVVWGKQDVAIDERVALEGMGEFMAGNAIHKRKATSLLT